MEGGVRFCGHVAVHEVTVKLKSLATCILLPYAATLVQWTVPLGYRPGHALGWAMQKCQGVAI